RASGIDIARRTVAKYREAMRIPSSVQRRRDSEWSTINSRASAGTDMTVGNLSPATQPIISQRGIEA
ncbi:hypothetical protein, partial [Bradyrhizobium zhanjiangense]|uniref:RNA polymerase factor sigma-54 n=1 Tax=Bradyrhizobium zhanjiangense TaxID=1325107 RepID=UPI0013E8BDAA